MFIKHSTVQNQDKTGSKTKNYATAQPRKHMTTTLHKAVCI